MRHANDAVRVFVHVPQRRHEQSRHQRCNRNDNDQFNQALVVDEASGAIAVVYYDTAADPGRKKTDLWYQSSHDDGVTWTKPLKVSTASSGMEGTGADAKNQYGDYNGLSGYGGLFFPSWTDRRKDSREEIWSATIEDVP